MCEIWNSVRENSHPRDICEKVGIFGLNELHLLVGLSRLQSEGVDMDLEAICLVPHNLDMFHMSEIKYIAKSRKLRSAMHGTRVKMLTSIRD